MTLMRKLIKGLLALMIISLIPFIYFFGRDYLGNQNGGSSGTEDRCAPTEIEVEAGRFNATVSWNTAGECTGYIRYSLSPIDENGEVVTGEHGFLPENEHLVTVKGLKPEVIYYISVISDEKVYGVNEKPVEVRVK